MRRLLARIRIGVAQVSFHGCLGSSIAPMSLVLLALVAVAPTRVAAKTSAAAPSPALRLLYASDWSGSTEIYSVDSAHPGTAAQVTFGHDGSCDPLAGVCGFADVMPSPDGRHIAFETAGLCDTGDFYVDSGYLYVSRPDGRARRRVARLSGCGDVAWSPDSRHLAFTTPGAIYVARANGSHERALAGTSPAYLPDLVAWSPDSRRIAYIILGGVRVAQANGSADRVLAIGAIDELAWSHDSREVAFVAKRPYCDVPTRPCPPSQVFLDPSSGDLSVMSVAPRAKAISISASVDGFAWSPSTSWLVYSTYDRRVVLVRPDGSDSRQVSADYALGIFWSHDGRHFAFEGGSGVHLVDVATGGDRLLGGNVGYDLAWSPNGRVLAFGSPDGIAVYTVASGTTRVLSRDYEGNSRGELVWAPDGRALALWNGGSGDLQVVGLAGGARTVVAADGPRGGNIGGIVWTRGLVKARYRRPASRDVATVSDDELHALWPIERIAADGSRVLYVSCGHLFVWTPATGETDQVDPVASLAPRCTTANNYVSFDIYSLAIAGDRVAFGTRNGNMSQGWGIYEEPMSSPASVKHVDEGGGYGICTVGNGGLGDLVGAGSLIVFSRWHEQFPPDTCGPIVSQQIYRLDTTPCPCPLLAGSPGPLMPTDVDAGRVVAVGTNETEVLNSSGKPLLAVPIHALAAQLSGSDLVIVVQGQLLDYDATTGALLHAWPLPDVLSGGPCGSPHPWGCPTNRLELEDAARGLAAYVLDGQVHVMRLADGKDVTVAKGATARFIDTGLVYADGADLHLVPFAQLQSR